MPDYILIIKLNAAYHVCLINNSYVVAIYSLLFIIQYVFEHPICFSLLSDHFDGKQSKQSVDLPLTCHPSARLASFSFRSSEVRRLFLDLDPYGGSNPLGMFPIFLKRTTDVLADPSS